MPRSLSEWGVLSAVEHGKVNERSVSSSRTQLWDRRSGCQLILEYWSHSIATAWKMPSISVVYYKAVMMQGIGKVLCE